MFLAEESFDTVGDPCGYSLVVLRRLFRPDSKGQRDQVKGTHSPNNLAAGNAGIASRLTAGHYWSVVPEPER